MPRADVRFARPSIQVYDAHVVDLYQRCARYLVGVKCRTKAKRRYARLSNQISERGGYYDVQRRDDFAMRGKFTANAEVRFSFWTVRPKILPYPR